MKRFIIGILLLAMLTMSLTGCVSRGAYENVQQDLSTAEGTVSDQQAQIAELSNELNRASEALETEQGRSEELVSSLELTGAELEETQTTLASTEITLADTQAARNDLRVQLTVAQEQLVGFDELKSLFYAMEGTFEKSTDTMWHAPQSADDRHNMGLWLIGLASSQCVQSTLSDLGFRVGTLGSSTKYIYSRLSYHWCAINRVNTVFLYLPSREPWSALAAWPTQYKSLFPFSVSFLQQQSVPFAFLEKDVNTGLIRAIIVAESDDDFVDLITKMVTQEVPIGTPWTAN